MSRRSLLVEQLELKIKLSFKDWCLNITKSHTFNISNNKKIELEDHGNVLVQEFSVP